MSFTTVDNGTPFTAEALKEPVERLGGLIWNCLNFYLKSKDGSIDIARLALAGVMVVLYENCPSDELVTHDLNLLLASVKEARARIKVKREAN